MTTRGVSKLVTVTTSSTVFNVATEFGTQGASSFLLLTNLGSDWIAIDETGGTVTASGDDFKRIPAGGARSICWCNKFSHISNSGSQSLEVSRFDRNEISA